MSTEVRVVDPKTGGEKGQKLARFDLIPPGPLHTLAEHYGVGARKYEDRNWEKGYDWGLSFAALNRHLWAFWNGEYYDEETGLPHLASAVFHAFALMEFHDKDKGTDSRPAPPAPEWGDVRDSIRVGDETFIEWQRRLHEARREAYRENHPEWIDHGGEA